MVLFQDNQGKSMIGINTLDPNEIITHSQK